MKKDDRRDAGRDRSGDGGKRGGARAPGASAPGAGFGPGGYGGYGQGSPPSGEAVNRRAGETDTWSPATTTHELSASSAWERTPSASTSDAVGLGGSATGVASGEAGEAEAAGVAALDATGEGRGRWQRAAITAGDIMTRDLRAAREETTAAELAQIMKEENCGVVPVVDEDRVLVGMVTDRDLVLRVAAAGKPFESTRAGEVMTREVEAVGPEEELEHVIGLMGRKQVRRIPVVDRDDQLLGIISMSDVANRADYEDELEEALERVSSRRSFWSRLG